MKLNTKNQFAIHTHEGGKASHISSEQQLRRSVMSCFLWEREFYEDGESISQRIKNFSESVSPEFISELAIDARNKSHLRHMPLYLTAILASRSSNKTSLVSDTLYKVITRADELPEFLVIYANLLGVSPGNIKKYLTAQIKKGLAKAFTKFNAYQLGKYNRDGVIKLRDVLFLCHAKPKDAEQAVVFKKLADNTLESPDTWEVALSSGADKKATFERLLREGNLGYLALLRNLRNMWMADVDSKLITAALAEGKGSEKVLPFRYIAAARAAIQYEPQIDQALLSKINSMNKLSGTTVVLVDVSGSMDCEISRKSDLKRIDAAAALGAIIQADNLRLFSFSYGLAQVPARKGMAGIDAIIKSQSHSSTYLGAAIRKVNELVNYDRIIVITDEQSDDAIPAPKCKHAYMINIASNQNGVGYQQWIHIDGFSENVLNYIHEIEREE